MDKKEYRYRKHINWGQYAVPIFFGFLTICSWGALLFFAITKGSIPKVVLVVLPPLSFFFLIEAVVLWFLYYRMAGIRISIGEEEIIYANRKGTLTIPLGEITQLKFPSINYLGGWVKIISQKGVIRLTVVIQDIGGFLKELKEFLDKKELSDSYDRKKLYRFFKTAVFSDQSWTRLYKIIGKLILFTILGGITGVLCAIIACLNIKGIIIMSAISIIWPTVVYLYTEAVFGRQLAKKSNEESFTCPPSHPVYEKALYQKAIKFGILIYFIVSITILFFINSIN